MYFLLPVLNHTNRSKCSDIGLDFFNSYLDKPTQIVQNEVMLYVQLRRSERGVNKLMKRTVRFLIAVLIVCLTLVKVSAPVAAQFTPGQPHWQFDPETTQVGRNAERARELIYWVYTHPPIYNVEVLSELWIIVRNITYALTLLVIIGLALHLVLTARRIGPTFTGISIGMERLNLSNIIVRIIAILIFVTFSYIIVRGFIEGAEIATKFIQAIAGEDLFTVVFGTDGNTESNYTFVGYRNYDPYEQDMVFTSLFLVRLTSFTYNFMAVILIMRHIVLMYLLILSPMLGLLMAFIFIRNTGYIWIGVFFMWLFYGPLFTLFIVSLAKIWKAGIPYGFDFSRAIRGEQVFHTGINILYGGPGQVGDHALSPTNTANYIDTYAEYVIALVMLWTAILLPWLLLRIFRDYCCDIMERNNTAIVQALDRFRTLGQPPKPPKPGSPSGATQKLDIELPFRQKIQIQPPQRTGTTVSSSTSDRSTSSSEVTRERVIERINNNEIHTVQTSELQQVYDLKVESLRDVARLEMQKETSSAVTQTLRQIQNPISATEETTQRQFETIKNEISKRAAQGDQAAQNIVNAANSKISEIKQTTQQISSQVLREAVQRPGVPVAVSQAQKQTEQTILSSSQAVLRSVAEKTNTSAEKVEQVLKAVPQTERSKEERITMISERVAVPREQVQKVLSEAPKNISVENLSSATILNAISEKTDVSSEKVEQILKESTATESTKEERVEMIAQQTSIPRSEVQKIVDSASTEQINMSTISSTVAERTDVSEDKVEQVLSQMSESEKSIEAQTSTIAEKIGAPAETVRQIIEAVPAGTSSEQFSSSTVINTISEKTNADRSTVEQVLSQIPQTVSSKEETVTQVAKETGLSTEQVEKIVETAESEREIRESIIQQVSEKTEVEHDKVEQIIRENSQLSTSATSEKTMEQQISLIAEHTGMSTEKVRQIGEAARAGAEGALPTVTPAAIQSISEKTETSEENVQEVLKELSQATESKEMTEQEKLQSIAEKVGVSQEKVKEVLNTVPMVGAAAAAPVQALVVTPATIQQVAEKTQVGEQNVERILDQFPRMSGTQQEREEKIAEEVGISAEEVHKVIGATPKAESQESAPGPVEGSPVSIEEYEDVKSMWKNHYQSSEVPVSDMINNREEWIEEDIKTLTNTLDLLSSPVAKNRQKGMEQVSTILPFLLLGGFSDVETMTYIKAKVEAAKNVIEEMKEVQKVTDKIASTEEFVDVESGTTEAVKTMKVEQRQDLPGFADSTSSRKESYETTDRVVERTSIRERIIEKILGNQIHTVDTSELQQAFDLQVKSLKDVARLELNKETNTTVTQVLRSIQNPTTVQEGSNRQQFQTLSTEIRTRAEQGDTQAQRIVEASTNPEEQAAKSAERMPTDTVKQVAAQTRTAIATGAITPAIVTSISDKTKIDKTIVEKVLKESTNVTVSSALQIKEAAQKLSVPETHVQVIVNAVQETQALAPMIIAKVAEKTNTSHEQVNQILSSVSTLETHDKEDIQTISEKTTTESATVEKVLATATIEKNDVEKIAEKTNVSTEKVSEILKEAQLQKTDRIEKLAMVTGLSTEQITTIINTANTETGQAIVSVPAPEIITTIAEKTNTSKEEVTKILQTVSETKISETERIERIAQATGIPTRQVQQVLSAVPAVQVTVQEMPVMTPAIIQQVAQKTSLPENNVEHVLTTFTGAAGTREERIKETAEKTQQSEEQVAEVIDATPMEKPKEQAVLESGPVPGSQVSIEDYEEVRKMWMNHYKTSEVPESENIKNRQQWIEEDLKTLQNTLDLLSSDSPKDRKKGMENVLSVLPFLLLGGFDEVETVTYVKAKLEAAKIIRDEMTQVSEATGNQTEEEFVDTEKTSGQIPETIALAAEKEQEETAPEVVITTKQSEEKPSDHVDTAHQEPPIMTETTVVEKEIIQSVSPITDNAVHMVAARVNLPADLVRRIADSAQNRVMQEGIPTTIPNFARTIADTTDASEEDVQSVLSEMEKQKITPSDEDMTLLISTQVNLAQKQVVNIIDTAKTEIPGGDFRSSSPEKIRSIAEKTQTTSEQVEQVLSRVSAKELNEDDRDLIISAKTSLPKQLVQSISKAVKANTYSKAFTDITPSIIASIAQETDASIDHVKEVLDEMAKSIKQETGIPTESSEKPTDENATHIEDQIAVQVVTKPTVSEEKDEEEKELKSIPVIEKPKEDQEDEEAKPQGDEQPGEETPADTSTEEGESTNNAEESLDQPAGTEPTQQDASLQSVTQTSPPSGQPSAPTQNPDRSEDTQ